MYWTEEYDDLFKKAVEGAEAAKKLLEEIDCDWITVACSSKKCEMDWTR